MEQQASIPKTFILNSFNHYFEKEVSSKGYAYDANPGADTYDRVFLLSADEVVKYFKVEEGDYAENGKVFWDYPGDIRMKSNGTEYAFNRGLMLNAARHIDYPDLNHMYSPTLFADWWLRSPGVNIVSRTRELNYAALVNYKGQLSLSGESAYYKSAGVRPAIWVDIESASYNVNHED